MTVGREVGREEPHVVSPLLEFYGEVRAIHDRAAGPRWEEGANLSDSHAIRQLRSADPTAMQKRRADDGFSLLVPESFASSTPRPSLILQPI